MSLRILHQNKPYPVEYNTISKGNYAATSWHDRDAQESAQLGFITPYAGSQPIEDITEVTRPTSPLPMRSGAMC